MAETWKSMRRCHDCLVKGNTNYLIVERDGFTDDFKQLYRLRCPECQFDERTTWDGK